jgi:amino acid permease
MVRNRTNSFILAASPFVIAVIEAGTRILPDIFNFMLLFFTLSAANAGKT